MLFCMTLPARNTEFKGQEDVASLTTAVNAERDAIIDRTMAGLETGLQVKLIATYAPHACSPEQSVAAILDDPKLSDFDHFPVIAQGRCIGVLCRDKLPGACTIRKHMEPLHDGLLVSAAMPILEFIGLMDDGDDRLMIGGGRVEAIITRSDLHKLPVRACVFTLITHLEMVMASIIPQLEEGGDSWLQLLGNKRREQVETKQQDLKRHRLNQSLVGCTDFCDKRDILAKGLKRAGVLSRTKAENLVDDLKAIEKQLRNPVAHADSYADDDAHLQGFVGSVKKTRQWIAFLEQQVGKPGAVAKHR